MMMGRKRWEEEGRRSKPFAAGPLPRLRSQARGVKITFAVRTIVLIIFLRASPPAVNAREARLGSERRSWGGAGRGWEVEEEKSTTAGAVGGTSLLLLPTIRARIRAGEREMRLRGWRVVMGMKRWHEEGRRRSERAAAPAAPIAGSPPMRGEDHCCC
jgi:hypothetical protein